MLRTCSFFFAAALSLSSAAQLAPFTYADMLMLDRTSGLSVSPTGQQALFMVRSTDMARNKGIRSLWLKDLQTPNAPAVQLTLPGDAANARFGPDGTSIYFLSAQDGQTVQLWKSDRAGNSAARVTKLPLDIGAYQITPDGAGAVVALAVHPVSGKDEIGFTVNTASSATGGSGTVYEKVFVRHWDTWADGTRNHLFHVRFSDGAITALTPGFDGDVPSKPFGDEADYTIARDGKTVYFSAREAGTTEPWRTNFDVYSVPIIGGALTNLTAANKAWDANPRVSPDGKTLAYKAMKVPGYEADRFEIQLRDIATGNTRALAATWDRSVEDMQWSPDGKSIEVTANDLGCQRLFRIDVKTGGVTVLSKDGSIDAFTRTAKGYVFLKSSMRSPSHLFASKAGATLIDVDPIALTGLNTVLQEREFGAYEQFSFAGWNNEKVYGYVVKPAGYVEGKKYPVAFLIHGGPQGSFGDGWSFRWNPQTYAGAGYAVVMIDFHGSTGYGQAFCDAIGQHWGDRPLEDLQRGWDHVLKTYPFLDGDRAAALGASYGGFMVNWIASQWKAPWKCLVSHDGVFDQRSMGYTTEEQWFTDRENGASAFNDPAVYDNFNPALFNTDWSVPMLIIHSDLDHRIPVEQGIAAFTALQKNGVPSQFLRFPDENHWVLKPQNSMQWHNTVFGWLGRWIGRGEPR